MNKTNLRELFIGLQNTMISEMQTVRKNVKHAPTKGGGTENYWINWLKNYLPNRYNVDSAIIIDHEGNISDAIDIVIYDQQYTPFVFYDHGIKYIPAESVYAVFEVKQELTKNYIEYAGVKAKSVRILKRTSACVIDKGIEKPAPQLFKIISGILTLSNSWKTQLNINSSFKKSIQSLDSDSQLNLGCVLEDCSFQINNSGTLDIKFSEKDEALIFFFLKLIENLQKLGTVRPIDIKEYAKSLKSIS